MTTYIISYDLKNATEAQYNKLYEKIKSYGAWAHITESTWVIKSNQKAPEIRNTLFDIVQKDSSLFVIKSGIEAAWSNVLCANEWLNAHL